jgi:hypothetical protein
MDLEKPLYNEKGFKRVPTLEGLISILQVPPTNLRLLAIEVPTY